MIIEIVVGVLFFVWGIIILLGKADKWLIYPGNKINMKRFRIVRGVENICGGAWLATLQLFGDFFTILLVIIVVAFILQFTWCRKNPDNFSSAKL